MKGRRESHRNTESIAAIGQEDSDIEKLIRLDDERTATNNFFYTVRACRQSHLNVNDSTRKQGCPVK